MAAKELDTACWLVEHGADVNAFDGKDGDRAIHQAAQEGATTVLDFLIRRGATVDVHGFKA